MPLRARQWYASLHNLKASNHIIGTMWKASTMNCCQPFETSVSEKRKDITTLSAMKKLLNYLFLSLVWAYVNNNTEFAISRLECVFLVLLITCTTTSLPIRITWGSSHEERRGSMNRRELSGFYSVYESWNTESYFQSVHDKSLPSQNIWFLSESNGFAHFSWKLKACICCLPVTW